jgi:hypothetical protein
MPHCIVYGMNSSTILGIEECAKEAGALKDCPMCGQLMSAFDPNAETKAYAYVTTAWKDGRLGVRAMPRTEAMDLLKSILERTGQCGCYA